MQRFDCKEKGCEEKVVYFPQLVPGTFLIKALTLDDEDRPTKTVYLECSEGHTHPYRVVVS